MNDIAAKNFRDYATRISFNLSLSRNQVGHLAGVVTEIEHCEMQKERWTERPEREAAITEAGGKPQLFIQGRGSLQRMGLIEHPPEWIEATAGSFDKLWKYTGPQYVLTPAGEHVVELLRIAGLIPKAAANANRKRKSARAA